MARHKVNNSFNNALRELHEDDELQGYDVKNAKRNKKKQKVNKFKDYQYYNEHN
tara:strand:+ start:1631 stop:1792 length:162 start_codon:yes stop_codon:yes gene_type:complete